jgi:hypothetical protein
MRGTFATTNSGGVGQVTVYGGVDVNTYQDFGSSLVNPTGTLVTFFEVTGLTLSRADFFTMVTATAIGYPNDVTPDVVVFQAASLAAGQTISDAFTDFEFEIEYDSIPFVVDPAEGGTLGADPVTITGIGFTGATAVTFDGDAATDVVVVDDLTLTCTTPAHAAGLVDVVITLADTSTVTITDGFEYSIDASTPTVDAGQAQIATGPAPSVVTTAPIVTRGRNNGTITSLWTADPANPAAVTIADDAALITTLTFATFVVGTYRFTIAVTDETAFFTATDVLTVTMGPTVPPRVASGRVQVAG